MDTAHDLKGCVTLFALIRDKYTARNNTDLSCLWSKR